MSDTKSQKDVHRIIFLGPPGAGKGTQAILLSKKLSIPHISTGDMMRASIASGSDLGTRLKSFLDSGALVPDELTTEIVKERLSQDDCKSGFILDGYPRTLAQVESLDSILIGMSTPLTHCISIEVPDDVLLERIRKRSEDGAGRSDDTAEVAAERLKVYWTQTAPVLSAYKDSNRLLAIDGLGTIEEVQQKILSNL